MNGPRFVLPLMLGVAVNPVNSSIIATALIPISRTLDVPVAAIAVLVSALYVASSVAQPVMGKLAQQYGPRTIFIAGMLGVCCSGIIGAAAPNLTVLVISRVILAVGSSAAFPAALLLIRQGADARTQKSTASLLGWLAVAGQSSAAIGLPLGGLLVAQFGWRTTLLVNVPLGLVIIVSVLAGIPADVRTPGPADQAAGSLDLWGVVTFGASLTLLSVALSSRGAWQLAAGVATIGVIGLFVARELRAATPFVDLRQLARAPALVAVLGRNCAINIGVYVMLYGYTLWLEKGRGLDPATAGLVALPMMITASAAAIPASRRRLVRGPIVAAGAVTTLVAGGLVFITGNTPLAWLLLLSAGFGLVIGSNNVGSQAAVYGLTPEPGMGVSAGLLRTSGYMGAVLSASVTSLAFRHGVGSPAMRTIALFLGVLGLLVAITALSDRRLPRYLVPYHLETTTTGDSHA